MNWRDRIESNTGKKTQKTQEADAADRAQAPQELRLLMNAFKDELEELGNELRLRGVTATLMTGDHMRLTAKLPTKADHSAFVGFSLSGETLYLEGTTPLEISWSRGAYVVKGRAVTKDDVAQALERYLVGFVDKVFPPSPGVLQRIAARTPDAKDDDHPLSQRNLDRMT